MLKNRQQFKIVLKNNHEQEMSFWYTLENNPVADLWLRSMKHLRNVKPHSIDSILQKPRDLETCYRLFCEFGNIEPIKFDGIDRQLLNKFHAQYMEHHDVLSRKDNNDIIYEFHQCIHRVEIEVNGGTLPEDKMHKIGYCNTSTPFHVNFPCNLHYADKLLANNIYLCIADSGKRPYDCWMDKESDDRQNIDKTMIAHYTFKPDWFISLRSLVPPVLPQEFYQWFEPHRKEFLSKYGLNKWDHVDEYSAVLLATPNELENIAVLIKKGFAYDRIELSK